VKAILKDDATGDNNDGMRAKTKKAKPGS